MQGAIKKDTNNKIKQDDFTKKHYALFRYRRVSIKLCRICRDLSEYGNVKLIPLALRVLRKSLQ